MTNETVSTSATTASVRGIVGPENATVTATEPPGTSYVVTAHAPTPRGERLSLHGVDPDDALRAMLRTPKSDD